MTARDAALGPADQRQALPGSLPVECFEDGSPIRSVLSNTRCYSLGLTLEKPTTSSAPNANTKIINGRVDRNTEIRAEFLKVRHIVPRIISISQTKTRPRPKSFLKVFKRLLRKCET